MKHTIKTITLLATLGTLAACGGGGGDGGGQPPVVDTPTTPSITSGNVASARSFITSVSARRDTPNLSILPGGTATYTGEMVTGLTINGEDSVDGLIGDVRLTAELFAAGDDVNGTITNLHTLDGNTPIEQLSGQLTITGELDDGTKQMTSTISGQLNGVVGDGVRGDMTIAGTMNGRTQDTKIVTSVPNPIPILPPITVTTYDEATGIYGNASGSITGSESGSFSGTWAVSE